MGELEALKAKIRRLEENNAALEETLKTAKDIRLSEKADEYIKRRLLVLKLANLINAATGKNELNVSEWLTVIEKMRAIKRGAEKRVKATISSDSTPTSLDEAIAAARIGGFLCGVSCGGDINMEAVRSLKELLDEYRIDGDTNLVQLKEVLEAYLSCGSLDQSDKTTLLTILRTMAGYKVDQPLFVSDEDVSASNEITRASASAHRPTVFTSSDGRVAVNLLSEPGDYEGLFGAVFQLEGVSCAFEGPDQDSAYRLYFHIYGELRSAPYGFIAFQLRYKLYEPNTSIVLLSSFNAFPSLEAGDRLYDYRFLAARVHPGEYDLRIANERATNSN